MVIDHLLLMRKAIPLSYEAVNCHLHFVENWQALPAGKWTPHVQTPNH